MALNPDDAFRIKGRIVMGQDMFADYHQAKLRGEQTLLAWISDQTFYDLDPWLNSV